MKNIGWTVFLFLGAINMQSQTFQTFLDQMNGRSDSLKMAMVDSFININPTLPYLENDTIAFFIFRGNVKNISIIGDANNWRDSIDQMIQIDGTNLWYHRQVLEDNARLDYKYVLNFAASILDPLNPQQIQGGFGPNSELRMPRYPLPPEIEYYDDIPHGTLWDSSFISIYLNNDRLIKVYLPPDYEYSETKYPLVLFHDGLDYLSLGNVQNILDYLIWKKRIEPVIGIFLPAKDRSEEYAGSLKDAYSAFIVKEIIPWIDSRFRTLNRSESRATFGISNGGNISLWLGLKYPEVFKKIAAQSSNVEDSIAKGFQDTPHLDSQIYLDVGTYDIPIVFQLVNNLVKILEARGFTFQYRQYPEGHSWGNWRSHIDTTLEMFFPGPSLVIEK